MRRWSSAGLRLLAKWQRADGLIAEPALPPNLAFNGLASLVSHRGPLVGAPAAAPPRPGPAAAPRGHRRRPIREGLELEFPACPSGQFAGRLAVDRGCLRVGRADGVVRARAEEGGAGRDERAGSRNDWSRPRGSLRPPVRRAAAGTTATAKSLGQNLNAYVPTTALGLLALQDRRDRPEVRQCGQRFLLRQWPHEPAGLALGLSLLCFRVYASADGGGRSRAGDGVAEERVPWKPRSHWHGAACTDDW